MESFEDIGMRQNRHLPFSALQNKCLTSQAINKGAWKSLENDPIVFGDHSNIFASSIGLSVFC